MNEGESFDLIAAIERRELVPTETLELAVEDARREGMSLRRRLVDGRIISEQELDFLLSEELGISYVHLTPDMVDEALVREFPPEAMRGHVMVPILEVDGEVTVALSDPLDAQARRVLERVSPYRVRPAVAEASQIRRVLDAILGPEDPEEDTWGEAALAILTEAFTAGASEIHIEPVRAGVRVRRRVRGVLEEVGLHRSENLEPLLTRFRALARLPDRAGPDRGRFRMNLGSVGVDIDLSILPTPFGDSAVLLLGMAWRYPTRLDDWGFDTRTIETIRGALEEPGGLVVVNAPQAERRRALAYALLSETDPDNRKVLTLEKNAFRRVSQWTQVVKGDLPVLDAHRALDLVLGQRPDSLLLEGPSDWALEQTLPSVLEGMRLILDTPYVDAADVLLHLNSMNMPPPLLDRSVRLVISLAALPGLCPHCRHEVEDEEGDTGFECVGCEACDWTGRKGEVLVPGLFAPAPGAVRGLLRDGDGSSLLTLIGRSGQPTIRRNARRLVRQGRISASDARGIL